MLWVPQVIKSCGSTDLMADCGQQYCSDGYPSLVVCEDAGEPVTEHGITIIQWGEVEGGLQ
jgi:hypothetical protein